MLIVRNFSEVREMLKNYRSSSVHYTLDRMSELMAKLGNPQNDYKVIHIAGTSGKTSTAYYVAAMLTQTGMKVGLTVSPHVDEINERVQINMLPMPETEFCSELSQFLNIVEETKVKPSYFELLIAFMFWEFKRQNVDYAVIEVGLGGLLDGTNVIDRSDKVCVITDIGLDHTKILGDKLADIATQKAGIILPGNEFFCSKQTPEVMDIFRKVAEQKKAKLNELDGLKKPDLISDLPGFQKRNWSLAFEAVEYVINRDELTQLDDDKLEKTTQTYIPARMEIIDYEDKKLIIDGSHNQQKLHALISAIKQRFPDTAVAVMVGLLEEKDDQLHLALQEIADLSDNIITTSFSADQDVPKLPLEPSHMADLLKTIGVSEVVAIDDPKKAFLTLTKYPEPVILVTGSFYLLNEVRPLAFAK
jgi:dihydrofolate synthase/folylpolyglutamate synthase